MQILPSEPLIPFLGEVLFMVIKLLGEKEMYGHMHNRCSLAREPVSLGFFSYLRLPPTPKLTQRASRQAAMAAKARRLQITQIPPGGCLSILSDS